MIVRPAGPDDHGGWAAMRARLWPDEDPEELAAELTDAGEIAFVAESEGRLVGFIEIAVRNYAEGSTGPTPYVEGLWVEPEHRRRGIAGALLAAAEDWARGRGFAYLGSDALIDNEESHAWHRAAGFAEVERLVVFGKRID